MRTVLTVVGAFFVLGLVLAAWKILVVGFVLVGLIWGGFALSGTLIEKRRDRLNGERATNSALAARAQIQHEQFLAGEARGIYGVFPPASLD